MKRYTVVPTVIGFIALAGALFTLAVNAPLDSWDPGGEVPSSVFGTTATPVPIDGTVISVTPGDVRCVGVIGIVGESRPVGVLVGRAEDDGTYLRRLTCLTHHQALGYAPGDYFPR